jgi:[ribulose-bisphosphate carboxylase]-lysine N-methyltransferase
MWALTVVYSRAVGIQRYNKYDRIIPPVLDMANHSPNAGTEAADTLVYNQQNDELRLVSFCDIEAGDEIFAVYGVYPNAKLAFTYGFVVLNNPHRAIDVWTKVTPTSYEAQKKQQLLNSNELTYNQTYDFVGTIRDNLISPALLATVRIIQMTADEIDKAELAFTGSMISHRNELATYTALRALLVARMTPHNAEVT